MSKPELHDTVPNPTRRDVMRGIAATAGAATVGAGSLQYGSQPSAAFVDELWEGVTRSNPMLGIAEYLTRTVADFVTGPDVDDLSNYVGRDALLDALTQKVVEMNSADDRVFTIMKNRLADSKNTAYSKAKIRIVEELNAGSTKADVKSAAKAVNDEFYKTIQTNLISHWEEQLVKLQDSWATLDTHADVDVTVPEGMYVYGNGGLSDQSISSADWSTRSVTLVDGSTVDVSTLETSTGLYIDEVQTGDATYTDVSLGVEDSGGNETMAYKLRVDTPSGDTVEGKAPRVHLWNQIPTLHEEVETNIGMLVDNVYDDYQSGDIATDDLIDGSTFASQLAAEESDDSAYAMADLVALGVSTNLDGTGTVRLEDSQVTVEGVLGYTGETSFSVGTTYYPTNEAETNYLSGDVYFAYDGDSGDGTLATADYRTSLDGGVFRLLVAPISSTTYEVHTVNDEAATATAVDFTETTDGSGNTVWEVDLSGQLNEPIADISKVKLYAAEGATDNGLIQITEPFTIKSYTNGDGSEATSVTVESYNHQTSDSLTAEELGQLRDAIEAYNDRDTSDSGGGGGSSSGSGFLDGSYLGVSYAGWALGGIGSALLGAEYFKDDDQGGRRGGGRY